MAGYFDGMGQWHEDEDEYPPASAQPGLGYSQGGPGGATGPGYNFPDQGQAAGDDAARREMLRGNFLSTLGREPTDAELNEAARHYYGAGGDAARGHIESLGWGTAGGDGGGSYSSEGFEWPQFNAPRFSHGSFSAPTMDDAYKEPGYEFSRKEGIRAAENSASGRGVLRSGGTLKDLIGWGNKYAEQNYANVYNRARDTFDTNYGVSRDVYDRDYRAAFDEFAPQMRSAELTFSDLFNRWRTEVDATLGLAGMGRG